MSTHWYQIAEQAKRAIGTPAYGDVMFKREQVAAQYKLSRQTLRNYLASYDFVQAVQKEDAEVAETLTRLPSLAVETYSRWWARDKRSARDHIGRAARDKLTVRQIISEEVKSRPAEQDQTLLSGLMKDWIFNPQHYPQESGNVVDIFESVRLRPVPLYRLTPGPPSHPLGRALSCSAELRWAPASTRELHQYIMRATTQQENEPGAQFALVGVIEVPSNSRLADGGRRSAPTVFARAVAATMAYPLVLVLCPTEADRRELMANIRVQGMLDLPDKLPRLVDARGEKDSDPVAKQTRPLGRVLYSSCENFANQWFDTDFLKT